MSAAEWTKSAAYRRGYEAGRAQGRSETRESVIRIHMADGRVLFCEAVVAELERAGWRLCPIEKRPVLRVVEPGDDPRHPQELLEEFGYVQADLLGRRARVPA